MPVRSRAMTGVILALALTAPAQAQTPPEGLVWYVLNTLNGFYLNVDDPTDRPPLVTTLPDGVLTPAEINHDGRPDWLIRWPDSSQFCGTGGCRVSLYISDGDRFIRAFDRQALRFDMGEVAGELHIETALHALHCSDQSVECLRTWAWDPAAGRLQERPSSDGMSRISGTDPVARTEDKDEDGQTIPIPWTPPQLVEARTASRRWCPTLLEPSGQYLLQAELYDIADVNGDGLRDWVFIPNAGCETPPQSGPQVWVTAGQGPGPHGEGGPVALAWTSPQDRWIEYDVSTRPATTLVVAGCETGQTCPAVPLRWNAAEARLTE